MAIELVNIDDRLIHGQVATTWTKSYDIESIIIVNDVAANDPIQRRIAGLAVPGVQVTIFEVKKFIEVMKSQDINKRTMLLFSNPIDVLEVINAGVDINVVNISGMRFQEGRRRLHKNVSVTSDEQKAIEELLSLGVEIGAQTTTRDDRTNLLELI